MADKKPKNKMGEDDFEQESGEDEAQLREAKLKAGPLDRIGLTKTTDYCKGCGGKKKQGYDDREDESLGMRRGKESGKKQSDKDRRDESYGKWGKRDKKKDQKVNKGK